MRAELSEKKVNMLTTMGYTVCGPSAFVKFHGVATRCALDVKAAHDAIAEETHHCWTLLPACHLQLPPLAETMDRGTSTGPKKRVTFDDEPPSRSGPRALDADDARLAPDAEPWVHVVEPTTMDVFVCSNV